MLVRRWQYALRNGAGSIRQLRTGRTSRPGEVKVAKVLVSVGLTGSVLFGVGIAHLSADENEKVWISRRGPLSLDAQRAIELVPLLPCVGSGLVAALLAKTMPKQVKALRLPISVHELTALPLSTLAVLGILLAFRFQLSYERWWASRQQVQEVGTNAIAIAMCSANNQEVISLDKSEDKPGADEIECNEHRMLGLLDAACALIELTLSKEKEPHPANSVKTWQSFDTHLHPDDAKQISQSGNRVNCCFDAIFTTIHRGQMLGVYSSELASGMYELASNMYRGYKFCDMIVSQPSPAPFAVHMRTILLVFCISFPFTIIGQVNPVSLMLMQSALSFSLMGIEFVSRQMEHPFGNDESDIPLRHALQHTRKSIRLIAQKHKLLDDGEEVVHKKMGLIEAQWYSPCGAVVPFGVHSWKGRLWRPHQHQSTGFLGGIRERVLLLGTFVLNRWHNRRTSRSAAPVAFVGGVPPEMDSEEVQRHLQQYGSCTVIKRCRGYLYVRFQEAQALVAAIGAQHLVGGKDLTVEAAKAKKKQWYCQMDPDYPPRVRRLMDGVVHVQNMLSMAMQIQIAKQIMSLGRSSAGFYTPRFEDRTMKLRMFCLGRHWDTQTHSYVDIRSDQDHLPVLPMPSNLKELVIGILSDLKQKCGGAIFPVMSPDTCIVNWYERSIAAGIPVISISLGSSARFLYQRSDDSSGPRSALLRSGDIFIFGNEARLLKHGVLKIFPKTCPKKLTTAMEMEHGEAIGRLNLTFRQT